MNKQELIEMLRSGIQEYENIQMSGTIQLEIDEATDLLRELEDEPTDIDDRKYSVKEIKEALLKQMFLMSHNNGYPSMAVPKATILSLGQLMRGAPDLPQPPKTDK